MIRFIDKEICCVTENELDYQQLLDYFLDWHMDEKVYILDEAGKFIGSVNYNSLFGIMPENAVIAECIVLHENKKIWVVKDYVILNENIWENGRDYFKVCPFGLLPVLNAEHQLICFAWNEKESNRELRMLDELIECNGVLDFKDVYPEVDCVTIHGCNELSYYFVQYLKKIGMTVMVIGEMWGEVMDIWKESMAPDYRNFTVFGEGCMAIQKEKGLRKSVSVEFECIDRIYEENIVRGLIGDTDGTFQDILERMRGKQIVILGTGNDSLDAFDLLLSHGVDIFCFTSENEAESNKKLFGKKILKRMEIIKSIKNPVFVEPKSMYSAWGFGDTDEYHYMGYKRNESFFLLRDYSEIPKNGFFHILNHVMQGNQLKLVLIGDFWLCLKLKRLMESQNNIICERIGYCDVLHEHEEKREGMNWISEDEVSDNDICLLLLPGYYGRYADAEESRVYREVIKEKYIQQAEKKHIVNILDYPVENISFLSEMKAAVDNLPSDLKVKKIVLGSIKEHSGNVFFRGLLDGHPEILMMGYNYLNENLFFICIRLAMEKKENILPLLWDFYNVESHYHGEDGWREAEIEKFNKSMKELMAEKQSFTSQELFVMIHIAYAKVWNKNIGKISDMIIYWEPHNVLRDKLEDYAIWLGRTGISGHIIKVVRNACIQRGSGLKDMANRAWLSDFKRRRFFSNTLVCFDTKEKEYAGWKRKLVRFEDLKCNPEEELSNICSEWGISWSDTLLETTIHGQKEFYDEKITGFDLTPVYRTYEEYYSAFDRFRITLINGPWQKQHGYPYVSSLDFSRRELQEMFFKEFRFEKDLQYEWNEEKEKIQNEVQNMISRNLWKVRRQEIMEKIYS